MRRANTRRIAIALSLGGALLVSHPAVSGGLPWDVGIACGYVCLILFLCLYVFPVRGDGLPHARLLGLSQHRTIGWVVLAAAIVHVVVLLLAEPQSARYLLPSAPVFMWCGVVALLAVVASVVTGLSARAQMRRLSAAPSLTRLQAPDQAQQLAPSVARRAISEAQATDSSATRHVVGGAQAAGLSVARRAPGESRTHLSSRATLHIVLAAILVLTACAHAIGSSQLLGGALKPEVVLLLICLPLGWYALRRRTGPGGPATPAGPARAVSHLTAVGLIALLPTSTSKQLLLEPLAKPAAIAVSFPHDSHTTVSCVTCHHNYVDHTGTTACIECHRSARTDLLHSSESTFHTFCRDCHTQLALDGQQKHGPTRSCSGCHQGMRSSNL